MIIKDSIYGLVNIKEKVLIELIKSKPIKRLKGISQSGIPKKYDSYKGYNRYEHSIGVMILLKKLNAGIKEQIAGLIHDASHTAFSHLIDWVLGDPSKEDYQDKIHERMIMKTKIPDILKKHGYKIKEILNFDNYPLLENEMPNLCADRIDYSLREIKIIESKKEVKNYLSNLTVINKKIIFTNKKTAKSFAINYLRCQTEKWASQKTAIKYYLLSSALKKALKNKEITIKDFEENDNYLIKKLKKSSDLKIKELINQLRKTTCYNLSDESITKKFRYVDPQYLDNNKIKRLSKEDNEFKKSINKARKKTKLSTQCLTLQDDPSSSSQNTQSRNQRHS